MINLRKLRIFQAVANSGNFTRAAEELYMSQPAVTQNIHGLEQSLGVPLFERLGRRIDLTPAGQALLPYVSRIDALLEEAVATTREAGGLASRTLRLGAGDTVATYILPDLIRTFSKRRPHATLHLVVGNTERVMAAILENEVEVAIWARQEPHPMLVHQPFITVPMVVVTRNDDPIARLERIPARLLAGRRLLLRGHGSAIRAFIDEVLRSAGLESAEIVEMDNLEAIKLTVEAGYGVTIAPAFAVSREVSSGSLAAVPLSDASAQLSVFCVYHADRRLSQLATTFIELLAVNATDEPGPAGASRDDSHYPVQVITSDQ